MAIRESAIDVVLRMRGQRAFAAQARATTAELEKMGVRGARSLGSIAQAGARMQSVGSKMTRYMTAPVAAGLGYATYKAIDFNAQMERLTTQAGATQGEVNRMTSSVLRLSQSGTVGVTPQEMAEGLYHIESQGYRSTDAMDVLRSAIDGAEVGGSNLNDTAKVLGQTMNVFGIKAGNARDVMSQFNAIVGHGDMTMTDLVSALSTGILPAANNFGLKLKDVGGALDVMTSRSFPAARAGTALKMALTALAAPTDATAKHLEALGINTNTLSQTLSREGLPAALAYMKQQIDASGISAHNAGVQLSQAFGGGKTGPGILTLIQNIGKVKEAVQGAQPNVSKFDQAVARWAGTPAAKLTRAKAQLEGFAISIGQDVAPVVADLAGKIGSVVRWINGLPAPVKSALTYLVAFAAVAGPVIWALGTLAKLALPLSLAFGYLSAAEDAAAVSMFGFDAALLPTLTGIGALVVAMGAAAAAGAYLQNKLHLVTGAMTKTEDMTKALGGMKAEIQVDIGDLASMTEAQQKKLVDQARTQSGQVAAAWVKAYRDLHPLIGNALQQLQDMTKRQFEKFLSYVRGAYRRLGLIGQHSIFAAPVGHPGLAPIPVGQAGAGLHHPGRALGGPVVPGGTALVGERGPELVQFPFGGQVLSTDTTKKLLQSQKGAPTIVIPVHLNGRVIAEEVVRAGETAKARR